MEKSFLIDTNILIYYTGDFIPEETIDYLDEIFSTSFNISRNIEDFKSLSDLAVFNPFS